MKRNLAMAVMVLLAAHLAYAQKLEFTNPEGIPTPERYTHVVKAGNILFISGQVGRNADGDIVGPGMREQFDQTLTNITIALKSQGADISNIAKITTYVTNMYEYQSAEVRAIRTKHFGNHKPASTSVEIVQLANPAYKVEVEAIAILP
jgi:2-iminobutanoate/2-iminopropanoate deaminase